MKWKYFYHSGLCILVGDIISYSRHGIFLEVFLVSWTLSSLPVLFHFYSALERGWGEDFEYSKTRGSKNAVKDAKVQRDLCFIVTLERRKY